MIIRFNSLIRTIYEKLARILLLVFRKRIRLKNAEAHSELSHTSMMKLFCGNRYRLLTVNSFLKNTPLCLTGFLIRLSYNCFSLHCSPFHPSLFKLLLFAEKRLFFCNVVFMWKNAPWGCFLVTKWFDNHVLRTTLPIF